MFINGERVSELAVRMMVSGARCRILRAEDNRGTYVAIDLARVAFIPNSAAGKIAGELTWLYYSRDVADFIKDSGGTVVERL